MPAIMKRSRHLAKAIKVAGGVNALARKLSITPQAVSKWRRSPPLQAIAIERATAGAVTRHDLRPDLYPREAAE